MWIEELPKGKYKFCERYKDPYTEKYKRISVILTSKSNQAKKQAIAELQEKIKCTFEKKSHEKISLEELLDSWWKQHKASIRKTSVKAYDKILRYIYSNLNVSALIRNTDTKFFQIFINELPHSWEYKKKFKSVFNMAFNYACDMGMIDENPITRVKVVKPPLTKDNFETVQSKYLEEYEVYQLLNYYYTTFQSVHHGRLAEFMYLTGLRVGEAISLTVNDYDRCNRCIHVNGTLDYSSGYKNATKEMPKTLASYRKVDLSNRAIEIIEKLIFERKIKFKEKTDYLFLGKTGKPIQLNSFNASLRKANESLGKNKINKNISSHIFRHSHISLLAELNVPVKAIMERVGHADTETTLKIYTHVTKKAKTNLVELLNKHGK